LEAPIYNLCRRNIFRKKTSISTHTDPLEEDKVLLAAPPLSYDKFQNVRLFRQSTGQIDCICTIINKMKTAEYIVVTIDRLAKYYVFTYADFTTVQKIQ
ncbi:MAG TPA: hypothetical protein PLK75_08820, partial [Bacteroidales bacterium]|nr:hypothetical protein [Bacteroidales bacterium]